MKSKLKELTSRSNGWGNDRRKESLRQYIIGWVNYFKLADMQKLLLRIDEWYRRRNQDGYLETMETNYNQTEESGRARSQKI